MQLFIEQTNYLIQTLIVIQSYLQNALFEATAGSWNAVVAKYATDKKKAVGKISDHKIINITKIVIITIAKKVMKKM